VTKLFVICS